MFIIYLILLNNIFNLQFDIAIKNIFSMYDDALSLSKVTKNLISLKSKSFNILLEALNIKKDKLLNSILCKVILIFP